MSDNPDFKIDRNGQWFHDGAPIKRAALAKLFSDRALKMDGNGDYWLQTPYEKYAVAVEDVPYVIQGYERDGDALTFRTNMDETTDKRIEMRGDIPYVEVRDGLYARINRATYYNLIEEFGADIFETG